MRARPSQRKSDERDGGSTGRRSREKSLLEAEDGLPKKKIIVIEDDDDFRASLVEVLASAGFETCEAESVKQVGQRIAGEHFDLAIIDVNLPDGSGYAIARSLVQTGGTKIILLTGRDSVADRVEGYTHGADIYMVKPTSEAELLAATRALMRKRDERSPAGGRAQWRMDLEAATLHAPNGKSVKLNIRECAFMERLMRTPGKAAERDELRKLSTLKELGPRGRALDMFVARLRRHIETEVDEEAPIETVPRVGFAFRQAQTVATADNR